MIIKEGLITTPEKEKQVEAALLAAIELLQEKGVEVRSIHSGLNGEDFRNGCISIMLTISIL